MFETLIESVFPVFCSRCSLEGHAWCRPATERAPWPRCFWCRASLHETATKPSCRRPLPLITIGPYAEPDLRGLIYQWKYGGMWQASRDWAGLIAEQIPEPAPLCPIPLHWQRSLARGYNQAEVLAKQIGQRINQPVIAGLVRVRSTAPQARLDDSQRAKNVAGAFALGQKPLPERLWLVDDVVTTGSTLREALRVLGRDRVIGILAVAHAKPGDDSIRTDL